jgi:hypothetical protein
LVQVNVFDPTLAFCPALTHFKPFLTTLEAAGFIERTITTAASRAVTLAAFIINPPFLILVELFRLLIQMSSSNSYL